MKINNKNVKKKKEKRISWYEKLPKACWEKNCNKKGCTLPIIECTDCGHPAHKRRWVDPYSKNRVIKAAQHTHFITQGLEQRRNCYHRMGYEIVDEDSFKYTRVVDYRDYLPDDITTVLNG